MLLRERPLSLPGESIRRTARFRWVILIGHSYMRNRTAMAGAIVLTLFALAAVFAGVVAPHDPLEQVWTETLEQPSLKHPMGTDDLGRDLLSRVIYGGRVSLQVGILSVGIAVAIGVTAGLTAGYYGGWLDTLIMRIVDAALAFPSLLLAILIVGVLGPSLRNAMLAIAVAFIPAFARITRANALSVREHEYVEAARALGAGTFHIVRKAVLPNLLSPIIVATSLSMGAAILIEAGLSFLGLGIQPPTPAWGSMLSFGRKFITMAWWLSLFPGLAIFLTVLSLNFVGDGLREALDPRQRRR